MNTMTNMKRGAVVTVAFEGVTYTAQITSERPTAVPFNTRTGSVWSRFDRRSERKMKWAVIVTIPARGHGWLWCPIDQLKLVDNAKAA